MTARIDSIRPRRSSVLAALCAAVLVIGPAAATSAWADKIANPLAVFAGLDKITAQITARNIPVQPDATDPGSETFSVATTRPSASNDGKNSVRATAS